jgi:hypothetical protein
MKIFGHPWIKSKDFYGVLDIKDIKETPPNSTILLSNFNIEIASYCQKNLIPYSMVIDSIKEAIFANNLNCKYIITHKELAKKIMPIAQNYLFDTQVLAKIKADSEIEEMARVGVDGVIFSFHKSYCSKS